MISSPSFDSRLPPQPGHEHGDGHDDTLARQVLGKRLPDGRPALEAADAGGLLGSGYGGEGILAGVGFELLELQLHLVEQAARPFGAGAVLLALQLRDLQPEVRDQRVPCALAGQRVGKPGFGLIGSANSGLRLFPSRKQERLERFDVVRQGRNGGDHGLSESPGATLCKAKVRERTAYPALCGRQLYCGLRQSIPSSMHASCEAVSDTTPSVADGQIKRPFSSRFA